MMERTVRPQDEAVHTLVLLEMRVFYHNDFPNALVYVSA